MYFYGVREHAKYDTSGKHTLCYRLDGNPNSVNKEFFDGGNAESEKNYPNGFPWKQKNSTEYVIGPGITIVGA